MTFVSLAMPLIKLIAVVLSMKHAKAVRRLKNFNSKHLGAWPTVSVEMPRIKKARI